MPIMTVQIFRDLLRQRPFTPFRVVMSNGQTYDVPSPEMAFVTVAELLVGVGEMDEGVPADFRICSLLHIASVEPIGPTTGGAQHAGTP
jgi:hypothetical protein